MANKVTKKTIKWLKRQIKETKCIKIKKRIKIVILHKKKLSLRQIGEQLKISKDTARKYVNRYKSEGVEGLFPRSKSGRPPYLKREDEASLVERIQHGPVEYDTVATFSVKYLRTILSEEYGADYSISGTEKLLRRLKFSQGKPRPYHEKCDHEAINRWKEYTLPNFVQEVSALHPKKNSKSGSKMKADLGRKHG